MLKWITTRRGPLSATTGSRNAARLEAANPLKSCLVPQLETPSLAPHTTSAAPVVASWLVAPALHFASQKRPASLFTADEWRGNESYFYERLAPLCTSHAFQSHSTTCLPILTISTILLGILHLSAHLNPQSIDLAYNEYFYEPHDLYDYLRR